MAFFFSSSNLASQSGSLRCICKFKRCKLLKYVHGGDPIIIYGDVSFMSFQALRLSASLLKSHPLVKSRDEPGIKPNFAANSFTRLGLNTSVMSTFKIIDAKIFLSTALSKSISWSAGPSAAPSSFHHLVVGDWSSCMLAGDVGAYPGDDCAEASMR